ncbi:DUF4214 domain-containing protein [Undibacterium aquatile]|uniref:DUF4214 domain-containing protein n=1 Tax=Undibacterium aquatile TaxID=1537398 RepID=A0ABR6XBI8_9BURK|nr:DUF4214 domain-containing protein [Undibacterium aquatile]MBC3810088.1 DUF4214 domain-containing protein [Undibacterium aquatile]
MKKSVLAGFIALTLAACGGSGTTTPSNPVVIAPPPAVPITSISLTGLRSDYSILKTSSGYAVTDKTGVTQTYGQINQFVFTDMRINLGIGDKSQTISPANLQSLIELYIAYFNRVPDADGLSYWIDQVRAGQTIDQIGQSFYNAAIQYSSLTGYSSTMTNTDFVKIIYKNVLGRDSVDQEGLDYWTKSLASGAATRGTLINTILGSAHGFKGDKTYGWVADLLDNKVKLANLFTIQQGINYITDEDSISKTMALVAAIKPDNTANAVNLIGRVDWMFREVLNPTFKGTPIPLQATSYLNAKNLNIPAQNVPTIRSTNDNFERITGGLAYGDFFQTGEISMVAFSNLGHYYNATIGTVPEQGKIYFFKNENGQWVDRTTDLLKDNAGCISPRKLLVADFNNDGIPDVYSACHGSEQGDPKTWPGENQRVLLSQPDGTYKNIRLDLSCYCHGAAAADIDNNGTIDIVTSDGLLGGRDRKYAYMRLIGDGHGNFTVDHTPFMAPVAEGETVDSINYYFSAFHIELVDMNNDGKLDMFTSGSENYMHTYILSGDGKGRFDTVIKQFPKASNEAHVTDMVFVDGVMYEHLYVNNSPLVQIRKFAKDFSSYEVVYSKEGQDFVWFMPFNNMLVAYDSVYGFAINK